MKIIVLLLVISASSTFSGCKKQSVLVLNSIVGTWELSQDGGGWSPVVNHKRGNDTLAIFTTTTYSFYDGNKLVASGTYTVKKDTSYLYNRLCNQIIFDNNTNITHEFFDIQDNQLHLWIDAYDAGSSTYRRLK